MLNALAAHKKTKQYRLINKSTNDIDKIWVAIEIAICRGLFYISYTTSSLDQGLQEYLRMNGYTVDSESNGNATVYTISWEDIC
jgi:hypothetical protein